MARSGSESRYPTSAAARPRPSARSPPRCSACRSTAPASGRSIDLPRLIAACARAGVAWQHLAVFHAPGGEPVQAHGGKGRVFPDYTFGCHAAEVEVDLDLGQVRILKYAACHDVGRAINPQSVEGQIQGAAAQGIGYALSEDVVLVD